MLDLEVKTLEVFIALYKFPFKREVTLLKSKTEKKLSACF
jgi:hypothetical protein